MNWHVGAMPERPNLDPVVFAEDRSRQTHPSLREVDRVYQWYANVITPPARLSVMMKWRHIHQLAAGRWKRIVSTALSKKFKRNRNVRGVSKWAALRKMHSVQTLELFPLFEISFRKFENLNTVSLRATSSSVIGL